MPIRKIQKHTVSATPATHTHTHTPHNQIKLPSMLLPQHEIYTHGTGYKDVSSCNSYLKQVIPKLNFEMEWLQKFLCNKTN
jgi:hypothetical protein